jgi:hypothetical protein
MPGLFRRPPQPQQRIRKNAAIAGAPVAVDVNAGVAEVTVAALGANTAIEANAGASAVAVAWRQRRCRGRLM